MKSGNVLFNGQKVLKNVVKEYYHDKEKKTTVCKLSAEINAEAFPYFWEETYIYNILRKYFNKNEIEYGNGLCFNVRLTSKTKCCDSDKYDKKKGEIAASIKATERVYKKLWKSLYDIKKELMCQFNTIEKGRSYFYNQYTGECGKRWKLLCK